MNESGSFTSNLQTILHTISIPSFQNTGSETLKKNRNTCTQSKTDNKHKDTNYDNNAMDCWSNIITKTHTAASGHSQKSVHYCLAIDMNLFILLFNEWLIQLNKYENGRTHTCWQSPCKSFGGFRLYGFLQCPEQHSSFWRHVVWLPLQQIWQCPVVLLPQIPSWLPVSRWPAASTQFGSSPVQYFMGLGQQIDRAKFTII